MVDTRALRGHPLRLLPLHDGKTYVKQEDASSIIDRIERETHCHVDLDCDEVSAFDKCDFQYACPLFTMLPRELREMIWAFALAPYEDLERPFSPSEYYYRPDHTACLKTDTALLSTCRRVWLEANALPMLQAEHSFYFHRAAPDQRTHTWMKKLTRQNRSNFGKLRMFVQMYAIEGLDSRPNALRKYFLKVPFTPCDFQPRTFHVTVRHTDWWYWEDEKALELEESWVQAMLDGPDLRSTETFKLELETLDYKVKQLIPIVERLKQLTSALKLTHIINGKEAQTHFVLQDTTPSYTWQGPTNINHESFTPYANKKTLNYHTTTLTWKLRFPDHPHAHIPTVRRAPRTPSTLPLAENGSLDQDSETTTSQSYYDRPLQRRGCRLTMTRLRRAKDKLLATMVSAQVETRWKADFAARRVEDWRRRDFEKGMADLRAGAWRRKWVGEGSLLRLRSGESWELGWGGREGEWDVG